MKKLKSKFHRNPFNFKVTDYRFLWHMVNPFVGPVWAYRICRYVYFQFLNKRKHNK